MSLTLVDRLADLRDNCAPELMSPEALDRVSALIEGVPPALTRAILLEVRLGSDANDVDIAFMVERSILDQLAAGAFKVGANRAMQAIAEVYTRCQAWAAPWDQALYTLWAECDAAPLSGASSGDRIAPPGIWVHVDWGWTEQRESAMEALASALLGDSVSDVLRNQLRQCQKALPEPAKLLQLGFLPSRSRRHLRACIHWIRARDIPSYLERIGWPVKPNEVEALLRTIDKGICAGLPDGVDMLHLELGDPPRPRLGFEYALSSGLVAGLDPRAEQFLEYLVDVGLCTPAKYYGLRAWASPGVEPASIGRHSSAIRSVKHVKVAYEPGKTATAKAYLLAFYNAPLPAV